MLILKTLLKKVCPCMRKKEEPPKFKEETYKIVFLGTTVVKFEKNRRKYLIIIIYDKKRTIR